jgi:hypothetical protein
MDTIFRTARRGVAVLVLAAAVTSAAGCGSAAQDAQNLEQHRQRLLTGKCEELVRDQLKSPGSAKFVEEKVTGSAAAGWTAVGAVDSQNGFGALLRSSWSCSARLQTDGDSIHVVLDHLESR